MESNGATEIGAWQHINTDRVQPYTRMNVWDGVSGSRLTFDWADTKGLPFLSKTSSAPSSSTNDTNTIAYMSENANLTSALLSRLHALGDTTFFSPARVESIDLGTDTPDLDLRSWPLIRLSTGQTLAARLLIGADGPNSIVRTFAGIAAHGWDYDRMGVVATLRLEQPPSSSSSDKPTASPTSGLTLALKHAPATAYQRFLPTGPAALLSLPNNHASLVWSTTPSCAAHLKTLPEADLTAMINAAFRLSTTDLAYMHSIPSGQADELAWRLPHTPVDAALVPRTVASVQPGSVAAFPLRMRHADTYTGERIALIGDAAHSLHPLAGQGLNLGLGDVAALARCVGQSVDTGADIGGLMSLEGYARERYSANHVMLGVVDKLHKVFSWGSGPVVGARSVGFDVLERWGWLKGRVMGVARG